METEVQEMEVKQAHPALKVTPLSKYLAMLLFIILPFLGGYIGYVYAPEKVVEVERVIFKPTDAPIVLDVKRASSTLALASNYELEEFLCDYITGVDDFCYRLLKRNEFGEKLVVIENLTELFRTSFKTDRLAIAKQYFSEDGSQLYFRSFIPSSSGCCAILKFNIENLVFEKSNLGINLFGGDQVSASGRYIARVGADGNAIEVIDITKDQVVASREVLATETTWASYCGYDGAYGSLEWKSEDELTYGVYDKASLEVDKCEGVLVEHGTLVVTNH